MTTTCDHSSMDLDTLFGHSCPDDIRPMMRATRPNTYMPDSYRPVGIDGLTEEQHYGSGSARTSSMATPGQVSFLVDLGMDEKAARRLNKTAASAEIDKRKAERDAQPKPEAPAADRRSNRYGAKCVKCGGWVEAEAGYLAKTAAGKWAAEHKACPEAPAAPEPAAELADGMYKKGELVVKVYHAVHGSGQQVSKTWDADAQGFEYTGKRGLRGLTAEHKMTLEDAKAFGQVYGVCCVCARTLTDEESIANGIGPICAKGF